MTGSKQRSVTKFGRRHALKLIGGAGSVAAASGLPMPAIAQNPQFQLRVVTVQQRTQEPFKVLERWCEAVKARTNGTVNATLYGPEAVPGGERDALEGVRALGVYEACSLTTGLLSTVEPKYGLPDLPFIFKNREQAFKALDGEVGQTLDQMLIGTAGLKPLMRTYSLFRHTHLRTKPIQTVADFKGVKVRAIQAPIPIRMFQLLGANAVPMAAPEVYTAIQTGVIDGWETPLDAHIAWKTHEVAKHTSLTGHQYVDVVLTIKNDYFQRLPKEIQDVLVATAKELVVDHRQRMAQVDIDAEAKLKEVGATVTAISDKTPFQEAVAPIYDEVGKRLGIVELIAKARAA